LTKMLLLQAMKVTVMMMTMMKIPTQALALA
jgi:hypothetical protein